MNQNISFLKEVLSIPTVSYEETLMVEYIVSFMKKNNIEYYVDSFSNIYATKQTTPELPDNFYFPCVVAHTDTVHSIETINIFEDLRLNSQSQLKPSLYALNGKGAPTGIGGDDKCGVFACLSLLLDVPDLKAAFFVSEEVGCIGSLNADKSFFENVGYAIQFDAPGNWMISEYCSGVQLFDRDSEFFDKCNIILTENMDNKLMKYMSNPYTDVYALKQKFDFSCINFSIGYYKYHTKHEYVVIDDVFNGIKIGKLMIESLGNNLYEKKASKLNLFSDFSKKNLII